MDSRISERDTWTSTASSTNGEGDYEDVGEHSENIELLQSTIHKKSRWLRQWRRRELCLAGREIWYSRDAPRSHHRQWTKFIVTDVQNVPDMPADRPHCFIVKVRQKATDSDLDSVSGSCCSSSGCFEMCSPVTRLELSAATAKEKHEWCTALESALKPHVIEAHTTTLKLRLPSALDSTGSPSQVDYEREASNAYTSSYVKMKDAQFDYG